MQNNSLCELCAFQNPKLTVTAIIIKNGKLLVVRRNEEPFRNEWDFVGGYVQQDESADEALKREIAEELHVDAELTYIGSFSGTASYDNKTFPVLNFAYLVKINGDIQLNTENSEYTYRDLHTLGTIAFDSNQKILSHIKKIYKSNFREIKNLVSQLDATATINEFSWLMAVLDGHVCEMYHNDKLIGMGWIYPRQTLLRSQAVIEDMIVDVQYRSQGYGKKILLELIDWAKKNNIDVIELTTNPKRVEANSLYAKVGFTLHATNHYLYKL